MRKTRKKAFLKHGRDALLRVQAGRQVGLTKFMDQSHQTMEPMAAAASQMSSTARVRLRPVRTSRCDR